MNDHAAQWHKIYTMILQERVPAALLLVGPMHAQLNLLAIHTAQALCCKNRDKNGFIKDNCLDCCMIDNKEHPDLVWLEPEKKSTVVKIDQIREMQEKLYLSPQRGSYKFVVIAGADKLNNSAENALLKILEEPPKHIRFMLLAEQLGTIAPTLLSRCQRIHCYGTDISSLDLSVIGHLYPGDSERAIMCKQANDLISQLILILEKKQHPCWLAAEWQQYELCNIIWFLYLVYYKINALFFSELESGIGSNKLLMQLKSLLNPLAIYIQLEKINNILKKLSHNSTMNNLLALEDLLLTMVESV